MIEAGSRSRVGEAGDEAGPSTLLFRGAGMGGRHTL